MRVQHTVLKPKQKKKVAFLTTKKKEKERKKAKEEKKKTQATITTNGDLCVSFSMLMRDFCRNYKNQIKREKAKREKGQKIKFTVRKM